MKKGKDARKLRLHSINDLALGRGKSSDPGALLTFLPVLNSPLSHIV